MNDLVNYLTMACTGTGQATFYNSRQDQDQAMQNAHMAVLQNNRRVYVLSAALPINDHSRQLILENLLRSGRLVEDAELEAQVIGFVVSDMQFNRLLNLFGKLRRQKVNNNRVRRFGRLLWKQVDAYRAIKYAPKVRAILRHCHIHEGSDPVRAEIHRWLFGKITAAEQIVHNPKLASRLKAKTDYACLFDLPYDIARNIAVDIYKKKVEDFDREFAGQDGDKTKGAVTRKESLRAHKTTGDTQVDFERFSLHELLMYAHRNNNDEATILPFIEAKAKQLAGYLRLPEKVALIVDNSVSALGSAERRFTPLANMEAVLRIFRQTADAEVNTYFVGPEPGNGLLKAEGASNLRRPLVQALLGRPKVVVILSDGYENVRAGSVSQILASKAVRESGIHVLHLNPVAAAETGGKVRELAKNCLTLALPAPEQLPMVTLIGIAGVDEKLLEPMFAAVEEKLRIGDYRGARLAVRHTAPALMVGAAP
jgi:hypothetical protein